MGSSARSASRGERRATPAVGFLAALQLRLLAGGNPVDLLERNVVAAQQRLVDHPEAAARNRARGELGISGHAELANEEDVQRRVKSRRHLIGDRDTAARERQDDHVRPGREDLQLAGKNAAALAAISEHVPPLLESRKILASSMPEPASRRRRCAPVRAGGGAPLKEPPARPLPRRPLHTQLMS
jgi:hypothetical protein